MNKIIVMLLIFVSLSFGGFSDKLYEAKIVKPECKELYLDYKFFRQKGIDSKSSNDALDKRWEIIAEDYKQKFLECNNKKVKTKSIRKKYYAPNPYNSFQQSVE